MNKKIFKFFPAALAMVALASCSTDDLWTAGKANNEIGKKSLVVNVGELDTDEGSMRSSMYPTANSNARVFNENDEVRVYDNLLQAYDLYTYSGESFRFTTDESKSDVDDPMYMLFPSDMVEYGSWKKGEGLYALMRLATYSDTQKQYENKTDGTLYCGEDDKNEQKVTAYLSNVPEFGLVTTDDEGLKTQNEASSVFLTGVLKIKIEDGKDKVKKIRVRSLKADGSANTDMPLWGYFDAVLKDDNMNTDANKSKLMKSDDKLAAKLEAEQLTNLTTLTVDLTNLGEAYTSYVYIPIIPTTTKAENGTEGTYPKLAVEYLTAKDEATDTWTELTTFVDKQIKTNTVYAKAQKGEGEETAKDMVIGGLGVEINATTLADINKALERYASVTGGLTINVTLANDITIEDPNHTVAPDVDKYLLIPTLSDNITLNLLYGSGSKTIGEKNSFDLVAKDKGGVGNGILTINLGQNVKCDSKFVSESGHAIELVTGESYSTVNGIELKNANEDFTLNCTFANNSGLEVTAAKNITVKKNPKVAINAGAANVIVECQMDWSDGPTDITTTTGNVVLKKAKRVSRYITTKSGNVTVDSTYVNQITTETGTITINSFEENATKEFEVQKLVLTGAATVDLQNGFVKSIENKKTVDGEEEATEVTITSAGKSAIGNVLNLEAATITSTWNGEKYLGFSTGTDAYWADYVNNGDNYTTNVYTATQLANLRDIRPATLCADITLNETEEGGNLWAGLTRSASFDGNEHTVKNVVLSETAKGFFNAVTGATTEIKNLKIEGIKAEGELTGVGALAGNVNTSVNISNVKVTGIALEGDDKSYDLGGLIGTVTASTTVNVTDAIIDGVVSGYYNLGGVIGRAGSGAKVVLGVEDNNSVGGVRVESNTAINVVKEITTDVDRQSYAGRVGMIVGYLLGKLDVHYFYNNAKWASIDPLAWLYDKANVTIEGDYQIFVGCYSNGSVRQYVGYSPEALEFKYFGHTMVNYWNGNKLSTDENATKWAFNVFKNKTKN